MHFTAAVFTNTNRVDELEDLLTPLLEGNEDYFEFIPYTFPVSDKEAEDFGMVNQDGIWGYMENPYTQFDYWDIEKETVPCSKDLAENVPYAFLSPEGAWESCEDFVTTESWIEHWKKILAANEKSYVTYIDCHI